MNRNILDKSISSISNGTLTRYTTLPFLLDMLVRKKIVLLPPDSWPDKNDSEVMKEYKCRKKLSCLLALCFSQGDDTIHHWTAFAKGVAGCRIDFDVSKLCEAIQTFKGFKRITIRPVSYRKVNQIKSSTIKLDEMPFTKRWPYRCEEEFRIIYESNSSKESNKKLIELSIKLDCIRSITLSQSMPKSVFKVIKNLLKNTTGIRRVSQSNILENSIWIGKFKRS